MALWKQVGTNAKEHNVDIKYFKINPTEHTFFILVEAEDYADVEKTIGQCKKTGEFTITQSVKWCFLQSFAEVCSFLQASGDA